MTSLPTPCADWSGPTPRSVPVMSAIEAIASRLTTSRLRGGPRLRGGNSEPAERWCEEPSTASRAVRWRGTGAPQCNRPSYRRGLVAAAAAAVRALGAVDHVELLERT